MSLKQSLTLHLKNLLGWKTNRKIIVFSIDDYGNVRLDSKEARNALDQAGLKIENRFDAYDTLETREDLEMLFDVLTSVKDKNDNPAVFTPFALPCNIDFEKMETEGYRDYHYELLPQTFQKLAALQPSAYSGAWKLWQEGVRKNLLAPEFHGREHLNLKVFEEKIRQRDHEVLTALKQRSYTSISGSGYPSISVTAAFEFWEFNENDRFPEIIREGLRAFDTVFGYPSVIFNPPGGREHSVVHRSLKENGILYLDNPLLKREHQGRGNYKTVLNYTGKRNNLGQIFIVRNVVFEPTFNRGVDWVEYAMKQIAAAFRMRRPANISSHRVNFCGHIDAGNRSAGLDALRSLLKKVVRKWPEVEFMSASELGRLISKG